MISFDKDQNLGGVISDWNVFSEIGNKPITDKNQLIIAGGRHKMSRLCGFIFTAKNNDNFGVIFVCKLRSKINHQQKKQVGRQWTIPSRWFFMVRTAQNKINILSKQEAFKQYNFSVNKFFESDLFSNEVSKLQQIVKSGIKQARTFAENIKDQIDKNLAIEEVSAIELSIPLISEHRFEDKDYPLINYEIKKVSEMKQTSKQTDVDEDDIVQEASDFECEVKKEEEDGKEVFKLYELKTHMWVATFHDEQAAESFSKEYPRLKQQYIKNAKQVEAEKQMVEKEVSEEDVAEKELDDKIEEAMKQIYK